MIGPVRPTQRHVQRGACAPARPGGWATMHGASITHGYTSRTALSGHQAPLPLRPSHPPLPAPTVEHVQHLLHAAHRHDVHAPVHVALLQLLTCSQRRVRCLALGLCTGGSAAAASVAAPCGDEGTEQRPAGRLVGCLPEFVPPATARPPASRPPPTMWFCLSSPPELHTATAAPSPPAFAAACVAWQKGGVGGRAVGTGRGPRPTPAPAVPAPTAPRAPSKARPTLRLLQ